MAKADNTTEEAAPEAPASEDRMAQLTPYEVLNAVSKAAQATARSASSNDVRDAFIAFTRALAQEFGGNDPTF